MRQLISAFILAAICSAPASAERAVMEGKSSTMSSILVSSTTPMVTMSGLTVSSGVVAATGTFNGTGNAQYGLTVSSGIQVLGGTLKVQSLGGIDATGTGIAAATGTFEATGNSQYSLYTSSGVKIVAGTLTIPVTGIPQCLQVDANGNVAGSGSVCPSSGGGTVTMQGSPQPGQIAVFQSGTIISTSALIAANAWAGINYVLWSSSGAALAFSTGTTSFQVALATMVYRGASYAAPNAAFVIQKSSFSMVSWNPTNGYRQWGLTSLNPASLSTYTINNLTDDIIVALSSSDASGNVGILQSAWRVPTPGAFASSLNGAANTGTSLGTVQVASYYSCVNTYFDSCYTGRMRLIPSDPSGVRMHDAGPADSGVISNYVYSFVVQNFGASSANAIFTSVGTNVGTNFVSVDGGLPTSFSGVSGTTITNIPIPTGYHIITVYTAPAGTSPYVVDTGIDLPANVSIVRGGM